MKSKKIKVIYKQSKNILKEEAELKLNKAFDILFSEVIKITEDEKK